MPQESPACRGPPLSIRVVRHGAGSRLRSRHEGLANVRPRVGSHRCGADGGDRGPCRTAVHALVGSATLADSGDTSGLSDPWAGGGGMAHGACARPTVAKCFDRCRGCPRRSPDGRDHVAALGVTTLVLVEITPQAASRLHRAGLSKALPHHVGTPQAGASGTVIRSLHRLSAVDETSVARRFDQPVARVHARGATYLLRAVHTYPPERGLSQAWRRPARGRRQMGPDLAAGPDDSALHRARPRPGARRGRGQCWARGHPAE